jgi:hypothetical protein
LFRTRVHRSCGFDRKAPPGDDSVVWSGGFADSLLTELQEERFYSKGASVSVRHHPGEACIQPGSDGG